MNPIEARELRREYAPSRGVCGASLTVAAGECCAVLGRNGCGKTTFTRMLVGLDTPDAGKLCVLGEDVTTGRSRLRQCGAVLDKASHFESLSARQNAMFFAASCGLSRARAAERVDELLDLADLADRADDPVKGFSFGMRRKLALVEAMVHDPDLLILDEPTNGVDAHFLARLADEIARRCDAGKTTWLAGSDAEWFARAATRVAFMDAGTIVAEGTVREILDELAPTRELRIELRSAVDIPRPDVAELRSMSVDGLVVTAVAAGGPSVVGTLVQHVASCGGDIASLSVHQSTLRDAFLVKTGKAIDA